MNHWEAIWKGISEKDRQDFMISLFVVALAGVFILYYVLPKNHEVLTPVKSSNLLTNAHTGFTGIDTLVVDNITYRKIIVTPVSTTVVLPSDSLNAYAEDKTNTAFSDTTLSERGLQIPPVAPLDSILTEKTPPTVVIDTIEEYIDSTLLKDTVIKEAEVILSDTLVAATSFEDTITQTQSDKKIIKECVILVGSYREVNNATKMRLALEKAGYDAFVTEDGAYTNIGIYVSCEPDTLKTTLKAVRASFAADAIVLKRKN